MLTVEGCRGRLRRLREAMGARGVDLAILTHPKHVYYFSGFLSPWMSRTMSIW